MGDVTTTAGPDDDVTTTAGPDDVTTTAHADNGACRAALGELQSLLNILKDDPLGVYKSLKKNILDKDEIVVHYMEDVSKYCTFRHANASKCGYAMGSMVRVTLMGVDSEIMV